MRGYIDTLGGFPVFTSGDVFVLASAVFNGFTCTASTTFNRIENINSHPFEVGDKVRFRSTGKLPAPLSSNTDYYVVSSSLNNFEISGSQGGSALTLTSTGTGQLYCGYDVTEPANIGVSDARGVYTYNITTKNWLSASTGLTFDPDYLAKVGSDIYCADQSGRLAKWSSSTNTWSYIGQATGITINGFFDYDGNPAFFGYVSASGGFKYWNGSTWTAEETNDDGISSESFGCVYDGGTYYFGASSGGITNYISVYKFNGTWTRNDLTKSSSITSVDVITQYNGLIYVGGNWNRAGGTGNARSSILAWDEATSDVFHIGVDDPTTGGLGGPWIVTGKPLY